MGLLADWGKLLDLFEYVGFDDETVKIKIVRDLEFEVEVHWILEEIQINIPKLVVFHFQFPGLHLVHHNLHPLPEPIPPPYFLNFGRLGMPNAKFSKLSELIYSPPQ